MGPYDQCHCGSGKKYKFCCMKSDKEKIDGFMKEYCDPLGIDRNPRPGIQGKVKNRRRK